jgi:hypothetical protein
MEHTGMTQANHGSSLLGEFLQLLFVHILMLELLNCNICSAIHSFVHMTKRPYKYIFIIV